MPDPGEIRKRLLQTIERARRAAGERRAAAAQIEQDYVVFLDRVVVPVFKSLAQALRAEGYLFSVHTPADAVRLASDRSAGDYVEIALDSTSFPPIVTGRVRHTRGRETVSSDRPVREGVALADLTETDVIDFAMTALEPFVERG